MGPLSQREPYINCWNSHNLALSKPIPGKILRQNQNMKIGHFGII